MCIDELKKSFNDLSPSTSFLVGFVGAILVFCTIGFFILLGFLAKGQLSVSNIDKTTKVATVDTTTGAVANQPESLTEPAGTVTPVSSRDHIRGSESAPITLIEYSDFECPFCTKFHDTMKELMDVYPGKIKWVYRHFPLSFHPSAQKAAEASECAYDLGGHDKFWQFTDKVYAQMGATSAITATDFPRIAGEIGLNKTEFSRCLDSGKYADYVLTSLNQGSAAGVQGTPGTVLIDAKGNKSLIKGAYPIDLMKQIIDEAL